MISQQLLDYINQQSQQGMSVEQIKQSLRASGWQENDITEGFNSMTATAPTAVLNTLPKKPSNAIKITMISLIGIVIIGTGIYFASTNSFTPDTKKVSVNSNNSESPEAPIDTPKTGAPATTPPNNTASQKNYVNSAFGYSLNYPDSWSLDIIGLDQETEGVVEFSPPFGSSTSESVKIQVSATQGYTAAATEQYLIQGEVNFTKNTIQIDGIAATTYSYNRNSSLGTTTYNERDFTIYIPGKGENGAELSINGHCTTFAVPNPSANCSTAVDTIMNTIIIPSFKFTKKP